MLLETEHSLNGDGFSFRQDLGMYLKTIGVNPVVVATFIFVYLIEKDVPPYWPSSLWR